MGKRELFFGAKISFLFFLCVNPLFAGGSLSWQQDPSDIFKVKIFRSISPSVNNTNNTYVTYFKHTDSNGNLFGSTDPRRSQCAGLAVATQVSVVTTEILFKNEIGTPLCSQVRVEAYTVAFKDYNSTSVCGNCLPDSSIPTIVVWPACAGTPPPAFTPTYPNTYTPTGTLTPTPTQTPTITPDNNKDDPDCDTGDPVSAFTGQVKHNVVDFRLMGRNGLDFEFTRIYRGDKLNTSGILGRVWMHIFIQTLLKAGL